MYLWVMVNHGFGTFASTEIWTSSDSGESWQRGGLTFDGAHAGGLMQRATWTYSHDDDQFLHNAPWDAETETGVAQLYGGYIVPGSTLDDLHLLVSQRRAGPDWPYWTQQFRVRGPA